MTCAGLGGELVRGRGTWTACRTATMFVKRPIGRLADATTVSVNPAHSIETSTDGTSSIRFWLLGSRAGRAGVHEAAAFGPAWCSRSPALQPKATDRNSARAREREHLPADRDRQRLDLASLWTLPSINAMFVKRTRVR